jgi:hypothetical protein
MSKMNRQQGGARQPGQGQPSARPSLVPADPLPGWKALVQAALLLGIPLALLFLAKIVVRIFYPELGY